MVSPLDDDQTPTVWWSPGQGRLIVTGPLAGVLTYEAAPERGVPLPPDAVRFVAVERSTDPNLLRWCDFPGCLRSFHAVRGPAEYGWRYHRGRGLGSTLLTCPGHSASRHLPQTSWTPHERWVRVECGCGITARVSPTTGVAIRAWWESHILSLPIDQR